jgi:hypothetical protein
MAARDRLTQQHDCTQLSPYLNEDTAMLRRQKYFEHLRSITLNFECSDNFPVNLGGRIMAVVVTSSCFLDRPGRCIAVLHQ